MALNKITFENKETLVDLPSVADKNKCTASDLNQIKNVVNSAIDFCNEIIESGTSGDWYYIKYSDGTMIQTCYSSQTIASFSSDGDFYYKDYSNEFTFPIEFYSTPTISGNVDNRTGGRRIWFCSTADITKSKIGRLTVANYWSATNSNIIIQITAIGRWKA